MGKFLSLIVIERRPILNDQGLVTVHPACNGIVTIYSDSDRARFAKGAVDTLALGPLGLLIASSTRGMRAECTGCGKVFIRSAASAVIINKINLLLERGELVHRAYTPPPVPKYDPNEVHTTKAAKSQKVDQVIDSKVNSIRTSIRTIFACAILWSMFTGGAMAICEAWRGISGTS
jgi:hypothetical protein